MTQAENQQWEALNCNCIVYRAVLNKPNRDAITGKLLRGAFLRRPPKQDGTPRDTKGLSVTPIFDNNLPREEIITITKGNLTCFAIGSLHTGHVRNIESDAAPIDIIRDAETHANIIGLPAHGEDPALAEYLATKLADIARGIWFQ